MASPDFVQYAIKTKYAMKTKIRIVGNAKNIDFEAEKSRKNKIIAAIISKNPSEIWWDGDGYKPDSFTQIIKDLVQIQKKGNELQETTFRSVCVKESYAPDIRLFESSSVEKSIPIETFKNDKNLTDMDKLLAHKNITAAFVNKEEGWKGKYVRMGILSTVGNEISDVYCFGGGPTVQKEKEIVAELELDINYIKF